MHATFLELADDAERALVGNEVLLINFDGEVSDFVRFNHGRVRQAGTVSQAHATLALIDGKRRQSMTLTLSADIAADRNRVHHAIRTMRQDLGELPEDPYSLYSTEASVSTVTRRGALPDSATAVDAIARSAAGADLVGFYASGPIVRGFASSLGARLWHEVDAFHFDWSVFAAGDKAVKRDYAGDRWDASELARRIGESRDQVPLLARPEKTIPPGDMRVYLAPAAVDELVGMLNWEGVSARAQATKQSPLQRLVDGEATFSPSIRLAERYDRGLAPGFDSAGFTRPPVIELITAGRHAGALRHDRAGRHRRG